MNKLFSYSNDVIDSLISGFKSPQSVAKAYKQYLSDKAIITSKVISAIAASITIQGMEPETRIDPISEIIDECGLLPGTPVFTAEGDVVRLDSLLEAIVQGEEDLTTNITGLFGKTNEVANTIDALVDSYQVNKIAESAFATLEVVGDTAKSSIADMSSRVQALGMELSTGASNMMATIGDIMGDSTTGIVSKISVLSNLLGFGSDKIQDSDSNGIIIPDFSDDDMNGTSPVLSILQSIKMPEIDITTPITAVVTAAKSVGKVFSGLFKKGKDLAKKGWDLAKNYVEDTFVNPIDFVVVDEKSVSHILDVPFFDANFSINDLRIPLQEFGASENTINTIFEFFHEMGIGQMRTVYTPFSIFNIVKTSTNEGRIVSHIIPSRPLVVESSNVEAWKQYVDVPTVASDDGGLTVRKSTDPNANLWGDAKTVFDRFVVADVGNAFKHTGDDDPYYYSAVLASIFRTGNLMVNTSFNILHGNNLVHQGMSINDTLPSEWTIYLKNGPSIATVPGYIAKINGWRIQGPTSSTIVGQYNPLPYNEFGLNYMARLAEGAIKGVTEEQATNKLFADFLGEYRNETQEWKNFFMARVFIMAATNHFDFMDQYFDNVGVIPGFLPSIIESEYQTPMYSIVTDSKHGEKIGKLFKGIAIAAAVVVAGVVVAKTAISIKRNLKIEGVRLNGIRRAVSEMDPLDPNYSSSMKDYLKQQKRHDKKNKFLGMVGLGYKNTASSIMSGGFEPPVMFSNKDVLSLIS